MVSQIATDTLTAAIPDLDIDLEVKDWDITLDSERAPYVEARVTIATPNEETLEQINPNDFLRVELVHTREGIVPAVAEASRTYDLLLHTRSTNAETGETELTLRSDEAILIDDMYAGTSPDDSAEAYQASLREVVEFVLDDLIPGAALESTPSVDADFTVTSNQTNMMPNPSFEAGTTDVAANAATFAQDSGWGIAGTKSLRVGATAVQSFVTIGGDTGALRLGMQPGRIYTLSAYARLTGALGGTTSPSVNIRQIAIWWRDSGGTYHHADSAQLPNTNNVARLSVTATIPLGATEAFIRLGNGHSTGNIYFDAVMLTEGPVLYDYFDGDGAYPTDAHYAYAWTSTSDASTSARTRLDDRSPDLLQRQPGQKAWDFLSTMTQAAGFRLFCDEQRKWRLVDNTYAVEGQVNLTEAINMTEAVDTIDRSAADSGDGFIECLLVHYSWIDSLGVSQEAWDAAGPDHGLGFVVEVAAPYPGPGAAAAMLARRQGRQRTLTLAGLTKLTTTPGNDLVATAPGIPPQIGKVARVTFLSDGTMSVDSRGLTDTPDTAWILQPEGYAWNEVPVGQDWTEYVTP